MKRLIASIILASLMTLGFGPVGLCQVSDNPLKRPASPRGVTNVETKTALSMIAADLAATSNPTALIYESWDETEALQPDDKGFFHVLPYPSKPIIKIKNEDKTIETFIEDIVEQHGDFVWSYDQNANVVHVIEKHLKADPRWPLNTLLGEDANKTWTFQQARDLMEKKYGLHLSYGSNYRFIGYHGDPNVIVWDPAVQHKKDATVRDLVTVIVKIGYSKDFFYFARVSPNHDPQTGYEGLKDRKKLHWYFMPEKTFNEAEYKKWIEDMEKFKK